MKNKSRYIIFGLTLAAFLGGCSTPEFVSLDDQKYEHILTEFSRLRIEYTIYSDQKPPTAQYLIDSLAARHRVSQKELMSQISEKNPKLYQFLTGSE